MDDVFGRAIRDLQGVLVEAEDAERSRIQHIITLLQAGSDGASLGETSVRALLGAPVMRAPRPREAELAGRLCR